MAIPCVSTILARSIIVVAAIVIGGRWQMPIMFPTGGGVLRIFSAVCFAVLFALLVGPFWAARGPVDHLLMPQDFGQRQTGYAAELAALHGKVLVNLRILKTEIQADRCGRGVKNTALQTSACPGCVRVPAAQKRSASDAINAPADRA